MGFSGLNMLELTHRSSGETPLRHFPLSDYSGVTIMSEPNSTPLNPRIKNLTGQVFGRLTIIEYAGSNRQGRALWRCRCKCGIETIVLGNSLLTGSAKACRHHGSIRHGHASAGLKSRTYYAWSSMKKRCKPHDKNHHIYSDRGISVCERWEKFDEFLADMGECPDGYELDRINNEKGYTPDNCRWADEITQRRNQRNIRMYEFNGQDMLLADWANKVGIPGNTLCQRLRRSKWSFEKAVTTPIKAR